MIHEPVKFKIGKYLVPVNLYRDNGRIFFLYGFNLGVNNEIKMMEKRTYHGYAGAPMRDYVLEHFKRDKIWSVPETEHNQFQIDFLTGKKPYAIYKKDLVEFETHYDVLRAYQKDMAQHMITRRCALIHGDRGIGKTLAFFEAVQQVRPENVWYISSTSGIRSTKKQIVTWDMRTPFELMTYRGLVSKMRHLEGKEFTPPQMICFDEIHNSKSPTAQRSEACYILAKYVRQYWEEEAFLIGMSGTTSPNSPLDYWMPCHILCPGYLIEGEYNNLRNRLAITTEQDFGTGVHRKIVAWKDRDNICNECGEERDHPDHIKGDGTFDDDADYHEFKRAKNEVAFLNKRLVGGGLMMVKLKEVCDELPEKNYEEIDLPPSQATIDIARTLAQSAPSSAQALMRVRALSDGFQYHEEKIGEQQCPICKGTKEAIDFALKPEWEGKVLPEPPPGDNIDADWQAMYFNEEMLPCIRCDGSGEVGVFQRATIEILTPKEAALKELLDEHEEDGRLVVYAGFQGSVDRVVRIIQEKGWDYIKADGRGWSSNIENVPDLILPNGSNEGPDFEGVFQDRKDLSKKCCFAGQPGAAGEGITLTASRSCFNYSLTYNAKDYLQSQDRIHRIGMDANKGATIWNAFHLPTDRMVFNKLTEKIARQDLTLGLDIDMSEIMNTLR